MGTRLTVTFSAEAFEALTAERAARPSPTPYIAVEASWFEAVDVGEDDVDVVPRTVRIESTTPRDVTQEIGTPLNDAVTVTILKSDGTASSQHGLRVSRDAADYTVTAEDIEALLKAETAPGRAPSVRNVRHAQLVPIGSARPVFARSVLAIVALDEASQLAADGPLGRFGFSESRSSAVELSVDAAQELGGLAWKPVHIGIDGRFTAAFDRRVSEETGSAESSIGWVWWLSGDRSAIGFVRDDVAEPALSVLSIPLPAFAQGIDGASGEAVTTPPTVVTEAELLNNPGVYSEDPGAFCRPFSNPERVVSEKAFAVVARVQQPDISPLASANLKGQHLLDFEPVRVAEGERELVIGSRLREEIGAEAFRVPLLRADRPIRFHEPPKSVEETKRLPSGRTEVGPEHPVQWEDDIAQYQAATVALGHILEFRVRTRSNGYSLGNVASTLTLAPRQTKRIQKVEFERIERARREELTEQLDRVSDELTRERDYNDAVSAYLDEWATGSSKSGSAAAAGGFGFAAPPIVGGVGGGTSTAWSSSTQEGQRHTGASEQQRLRDAIRRHGDALRKLQSVVVTEVTQQETVTGTTEILRNPNYGHSLTVIYYQILRHLAVNTEFAGVRECLFVPFAIKPWTQQRAYRWRDAIRRYLRAPQHATALRNLRDVITQFRYSSVLPGTRANQKLTYLHGSVYLTIAVERPPDTDEGEFDAAKWAALSPFLGMPAQAVWARLAERAEAKRDQEFQREHAPTIAAKWVESLQLRESSGADLRADFTLASRYEFNRTVRVDFSVPVSDAAKLDRHRLTNMIVKATTGLPAGSVGKVTRLTMRYGTANFQRTIEGVGGIGGLLRASNAEPDDGAEIAFPLDTWDQVDEQAAIRHGVGELIEHLNEHVEFYHKAVWWSMDRDRLLMLLDGFYVPGTNNVSLASVVDREPVAIMGNSLVYRVGAGAFLGYGKIRTPAQLYELYAGREPAQDPLLLSLPTDGLYAQTIMDECLALEEHQGSVDWVLDETEPELGSLDSALLASRRAEVASTLSPTPMGGTIINLQNAPDAPPPTGLAAALDAATNPNAFRDMAGLAGTQANAAAALQTAAGLATNFGNQAAALKLAEMADKEKARQTANQQVAVVKNAFDKGLISAEEASEHTNRILGQMQSGTARTAPHENEAINQVIDRLATPGGNGTVEAATSDGAVKVEFASSAEVTDPVVEEIELFSGGDAVEEVATAGTDEKWIILVAGYNYANHSRGTSTYGTYARNRAALLLANNPAWKSNVKVRFLLINVGEGKAYVDDRTKGSLADARNWRAISELQFAGNEDIPLRFRPITASDYEERRFVYPIETDNGLITPAGWEDQPVFSILHWYNLLRSFGRAAPGSVLEASILSHGTPWGPILLNSYREDSFRSATDPLNLSSTNRQRDPADVDGRADADFVEPSMSAADAQEIQKAFAPDGFVWLWGCAAFGPFKRLVLRLYGQSGFKADGSTSDSTMFKFKFDTTADGMQNLRTWLGGHAFLPSSGLSVERSLGEFKSFLDSFLGTLYAERLASAFDVKCFATALGTGSEPDVGARFVVHHVSAIYEKVVEFYESYMRFKRDPEGRRYLDYKR